VTARNPAVDMFIYDGWHSYEYERAELELVLGRLAPGGVLLSDDAAVTGALADIARAHDLRYHTVHVRPRDHFHPGAALGAARPATPDR
jgi:predicted O-methyltransferase YrrM